MNFLLFPQSQKLFILSPQYVFSVSSYSVLLPIFSSFPRHSYFQSLLIPQLGISPLFYTGDIFFFFTRHKSDCSNGIQTLYEHKRLRFCSATNYVQLISYHFFNSNYVQCPETCECSFSKC